MTSHSSGKARGTAVKIAVLGPSSAGPRTLIRTISEITVLSTEQDGATSGRAGTAEATGGMDFGRITIDRDLVLYLYAEPGRERLDVKGESLAEGMLGDVLLVDGSPADLQEAVGILEALRTPALLPCVVALTGPDRVGAEQVRQVLGLGDDVPVVPVDVTDRESVKAVLLALLHAVVDALDQPAAAG